MAEDCVYQGEYDSRCRALVTFQYEAHAERYPLYVGADILLFQVFTAGQQEWNELAVAGRSYPSLPTVAIIRPGPGLPYYFTIITIAYLLGPTLLERSDPLAS